MNRKAITSAILAIWLVLTAIDLLQDTGWIEYPTSEIDEAVEEALDAFGEAVKSVEDVQKNSIISIFFPKHSFDPAHTGRLCTAEDPAKTLDKEAKLLLGSFRPYKVNQTFLI